MQSLCLTGSSVRCLGWTEAMPLVLQNPLRRRVPEREHSGGGGGRQQAKPTLLPVLQGFLARKAVVRLERGIWG